MELSEIRPQLDEIDASLLDLFLKRMSLIDKVASEQIPVVYTIEMSTQAVARTISEETGAKILTLHSMQTVTQDEFDAGENWVSLMEKNAQALREGLQ